MKNVLILKRISNDFDKYVCKSLQENIPNVVVFDPFKFNGKIGNKIINFAKNYNFFLFQVCLSLRKKDISKYNDIILFDDYPDICLLKWIKMNSHNCNIKLWFWNVPNYSIEKYRQYCDMYCFDEDFCKKNNINFINQFYFWNLKYELNTNPKYDVTYVGVDKNRNNILNEISKIFDTLDICYNFQLVSKKRNNSDSICYLKKSIPYKQVISVSNNSKAILELVTKEQQGLTWRSLEALFLHKKLITNNQNIVNFDFYCKENIFLLNVDCFEDLKKFLNTSYKEVNLEIIEKYTIEHWFKSIIE